MRNLKRLGDRIDDAIDNGLDAGAQIVVNDAKENAPYQTGTFRRSIHHKRIVREAYRRYTQIGSDITNPPYPYFLEYGTSYMAARPTLRPALYNNQDGARQEIVSAVKQTLRV